MYYHWFVWRKFISQGNITLMLVFLLEKCSMSVRLSIHPFYFVRISCFSHDFFFITIACPDVNLSQMFLQGSWKKCCIFFGAIQNPFCPPCPLICEAKNYDKFYLWKIHLTHFSKLLPTLTYKLHSLWSMWAKGQGHLFTIDSLFSLLFHT